MRTSARLSPAQRQVLKLIRDQPDSDAWNLKQAADCSLGKLAQSVLMDIGTDRLKVDRMHPVITRAGMAQTEQGQMGLDAAFDAHAQWLNLFLQPSVPSRCVVCTLRVFHRGTVGERPVV